MSELPPEIVTVLKKHKYHLVGRHSAVKRCHWLYKSLTEGRFCYKQLWYSRFYGIASHRCLQMTPTVVYCNLRCRFCWRVQPEDIGVQWNQLGPKEWDDPETIIEGCIEEQRRILSGYKGHPTVDPKKYEEALNPNLAAISLDGEPTLYPRLGELIEGFKKRGMTAFLVTNGTLPKALERLDTEPDQLYVSVCAPDEKTFKELMRPLVPKAWEGLLETLQLLPSFKCRKVMRITSVKGWNMKRPDLYAKLAEMGEFDFIEPKAYMHLGYSRKRLRVECMPSHGDMRKWAEELSEHTGYPIVGEFRPSRVFLLSKKYFKGEYVSA